MMTTLLLLMLALFTKHLIIDFVLQTPYQWMNKGTYGHPGGLLHAGLHGVWTMAILSFVVVLPFAAVLGLVDAVVHYHIDWAKMNLNKRMGWTADKNPEFWWLLGLDQYLHTLTYLGILFVLL
jgi:hypothetical protein